MKKILLFLSFCFSFAPAESVFAQNRGRGEIAVRSEDGEKLAIEVDGRRYDHFGSDLLLGNIPPGRRSVIVYRLRPNRRDGGATAQTVYEGRVLVRPGVRVLMNIDSKSGSVGVRHQELTPAAEPAPVPEKPAPTPPLAIPPNSNWQTEVTEKATDTEKLRILKAQVTAATLTTTDLLQMMQMLAFEDSRLELAQAALPRLSDRENFNAIAASFENPDSRKAFEEAARKLR